MTHTEGLKANVGRLSADMSYCQKRKELPGFLEKSKEKGDTFAEGFKNVTGPNNQKAENHSWGESWNGAV